MAEVPMIATGNFTYNTRRLKAGDAFPARNEMDARILERVRRVAELGKPAALKALAPPTPVPEAVEAETVFVPTIKEVLKAKVIVPKVKRRRTRAKAKK